MRYKFLLGVAVGVVATLQITFLALLAIVVMGGPPPAATVRPGKYVIDISRPFTRDDLARIENARDDYQRKLHRIGIRRQ